MSRVKLPTQVIINDDGTKTTISYHKHSNNLYYAHKKVSNIARKKRVMTKTRKDKGKKHVMTKPRKDKGKPRNCVYKTRKDKGVPRKTPILRSCIPRKTRKDKGMPRATNLNIYRTRYDDPLNFERKKKLLEDAHELIGSINLLELQKFLLKNPDIDPDKTSLIIKILA